MTDENLFGDGTGAGADDNADNAENEEVLESSGEENEETDIAEALFYTPDELNLVSKDIVTDMEESYISYAMSVIVSRALPDVRDGLKPVHRRILYAMHENGLRPSAKYRKSATVVGAVLGKYHPHGDSAVYMSMVRMAQEFSLRYPLVDGQGNFGSIDGDNPAAMRYTESKMTRVAELMLEDIEKDTVDFRPNYDATATEPSVLPNVVPQLLLNGTMGIAVGMATNIPPHHIGEIVGATTHLLRNPEATIPDLLQFVKGPDFPTGAEIYDGGAVQEMYTTGRGRVIMRAVANIEEVRPGKQAIIFTEIPYQVNKAELQIKIADLVKEKKISGITAIRDESNRKGIRVVIELKRDAFPKKVLNTLYKMTPLQKSFSLNMIALVDGIHPRLLNLKQVLEYFIAHRYEVIVRRTKYDLRIAQARAHILEGLKIALDNIDRVIEIIRGSDTKELAGAALRQEFGLSEEQTSAILQMRLQTLAGLERKKIEDELAEKMKLIAELEGILADKGQQTDIIENELNYAVEKFGDERRTKVHPHGLGEFKATDVIPDKPMLLMMTQNGYVKRLPAEVLRSQKRGGVGVKSSKTKDEDQIMKTLYGTSHNNLLFFTNTGRVFNLPMYEVPEASKQAKGTPVVNLLQLGPNEKITEILNLDESEGKYITMATTGGTIKKTSLDLFKNIRKSGLIAAKIRDGEQMLWARLSGGEDEIFMVTKFGQSIRFSEENIRPMGRSAAGVRGIKLKNGDEVVEMVMLKDDEARLLVVTEKGLGKMTKVEQYRAQNRGGSGIKVANLTNKTGNVAGARVIMPSVKGDLVITSLKGQTIRIPLDGIKVSGRATQGVILSKPGAGDKVTTISVIEEFPAPKTEEEAAKQPLGV